jgi:hypothetical protein
MPLRQVTPTRTTACIHDDRALESQKLLPVAQ